MKKDDRMVLELGVVHGADVAPGSLCSFRKRVLENTGTFNAVMIIPTGVGAELGGHAGDACPAARLLAEACDTLVLHPNVVNASDLNELPVNSLYVEGSVLTRLMMGTVGLSPVRSNRILVVLGSHGDEVFCGFCGECGECGKRVGRCRCCGGARHGSASTVDCTPH